MYSFLSLVFAFVLFSNFCLAQFRPLAVGIDVETLNSSAALTLITFAGYSADQNVANVWSDALGTFVGAQSVFSVRGPEDPEYKAREIQTSHLAPNLNASQTILAAAHSSGSFVAHNWFHQLLAHDATIPLLSQITYVNLDGGVGEFDPGIELNATIAKMLQHLHAVFSCVDADLCSPNADAMQRIKQKFPWAQLQQLDASKSECIGKWCVHMTLINQTPYDHESMDLAQDYTQFNENHKLQTNPFK